LYIINYWYGSFTFLKQPVERTFGMALWLSLLRRTGWTPLTSISQQLEEILQMTARDVMSSVIPEMDQIHEHLTNDFKFTLLKEMTTVHLTWLYSFRKLMASWQQIQVELVQHGHSRHLTRCRFDTCESSLTASVW